ncbi:CRISPR-associated helicase/endonuclease Cas3|uniref:CRISPR-associated helicase, Cas3 family n=1 Tax=Dendrosporobacter quercicolus TaxID=146817 RepID=A0A1G9U630_9FIRM|nr:CRISPR-associated helicase/endonuclease Cas3 [Dendrosporobacter quercicolus]NSL48750.1 CRISPR-associated helicase/endonuclease Cas3 [Dendrosporobacter quercicolus DSM 1736]SDM55114.1 CRISPR-associated helicase, Cas3 family [Dendrosporobacter quercicolus]
MRAIDELLSDPRYWAHTDKGKEPETLAAHSNLCLHYYHRFCRKKGLDAIIKRTIVQCGCDERETADIYRFFVKAVYLHDIGKINPVYQRKVLKNPAFPVVNNSRNHALLSAYIYLCEHLESLPVKDVKKYSYFLFSFSYCIARHHGYLKNIGDYKDKLQDCIEKNGCYDTALNLAKNSIFTPDRGYDRLKKIVADETAFYILNKLLFSAITACDYCATSEYKNGVAVDICTIDDPAEFITRYRDGALYVGIQQYQHNKHVFSGSINAQRCELFLEAERNLREYPDACLYYLEAPTGSGKTNISINLFLTLLNERKELSNVFYIFPFNTLVEQTAEVLGQYFVYGEELAVVNSLTPIYVEASGRQAAGAEDEQEYDYEKAALNKLLNNYPLVVTSHVNFFNALFSTGREPCFPLLKLCNSVVIIDEIQSYRNAIWQQIILFLLQYARLLNIKVIMMSATLPKLDLLLDGHDYDIVDLIKDPQVYYRNHFFQQRVELDFSLLAFQKIDLTVLRDKVLQYKHKKVLIEFINKNTAREFFKLMCQESAVYCVEITGDDNSCCRKAVIQEIKERTSLIVIATQVIEAGVDIDMDVGFKDVSLPDAEEQFLGRINRSCLRSGKAYFFHYDDAKKIYGNDERLNYPVTRPEIAEMLRKKDFKGIYEGILQDVKKIGQSRTAKHIHYTYEKCLTLSYQDIERDMQLIAPTWQIFLAYELQEGAKLISGREVWRRYKEICRAKDMGYGRRKVELSILAEQMSYFTYQVYGVGQQALGCDEEFGGYYYIEDGERFIEYGKFNRKAFVRQGKGLFL